MTTLATNAKHLTAISKETLRFHPQTAGGLRVNKEKRKFQGYDVPKGYVLTADPRIAFLDEVSPEPKRFYLERFMENRGEERFFPGGIGQHQCPGINLANMMNTIFLSKFLPVFSDWTPEDGMPSIPPYEHVPNVIIGDSYVYNLSSV